MRNRAGFLMQNLMRNLQQGLFFAFTALDLGKIC